MSLQQLSSARFVRRTSLGTNEYRKNFRQLDEDVIAAVTSREADQVTPLMSKIYLRLVSAPVEFREREGVLYFAAGEKGGLPVKASKVLYEVLGVSSATAHKALGWMHEQGIIGYFAGKNGAGIRIFLNRAAGSIGVRATTTGKKILPFGRGSNGEVGGSSVEPAFNDSYADLEVLEKDLNPRAPQNGAEQAEKVEKHSDPNQIRSAYPAPGVGSVNVPPRKALRVEVPVEEIVARLRRELAPELQSAAKEASAREHERTREWLESRGLPKAARVAQREAYNVLRRYGVIREAAQAPPADVGRSGHTAQEPQPLSDSEVEELAQACVAMLEVKGQSVEVTLSEMSAEVGGFLLPADVPCVRARTEALLYESKRCQTSLNNL